MGVCQSTKGKHLKNSNLRSNKTESTENYESSISKDTLFKINKSLCKITNQSNKYKSYGIGFFMNIKLYKNRKCLITNYQKISQKLIDSEETIIIQLQNGKVFSIKLDRKRRFIKFLSQFHNITIIEILDSDLISNDIEILDCDLDYMNNYQKYLNKNILIINNSLKNIPFGSIVNLKDYGFEYSININNIVSGSPIVLFENQKVIGIKVNNSNEAKYGLFIGEIIKELKKEENLDETNKKNTTNDNTIINENIDKCILIKYIINDNKTIKIFGSKFIENNKDNFKLIINGEEKEICEYLDIQNLIKDKNRNTIEIKLKIVNPFTDLSYMFSDCKNLFSIDNISNLNTSNVEKIKSLFFGCTSLAYIPDISKWDTSNVIDMGDLFSGCSLITSLPDISKWNTSNVKNMSYMFSGCELLDFLPNISNWDTSNVTNFSYMFHWCKALSTIPNISNWDTSNASDMSWMFSDCSTLEILPDLSIWKTDKVIDMNHMFYGCSSLLSLPNISFWNTNNVKDMSFMFYGCSNLAKFPDISDWNTENLENTRHMFQGCKNHRNIKFKLVN